MAGVKQYGVLELLPADVAATANGTGVDLQPYASSPREMKAVLSAEAMGSSQTFDVKLQESDSLSTGYTDITGAAFTQVANAASFQTIHFQTNKRYVRAAATASASAAGAAAAVLFVQDRNV